MRLQLRQRRGPALAVLAQKRRDDGLAVAVREANTILDLLVGRPDEELRPSGHDGTAQLRRPPIEAGGWFGVARRIHRPRSIMAGGGQAVILLRPQPRAPPVSRPTDEIEPPRQGFSLLGKKRATNIFTTRLEVAQSGIYGRNNASACLPGADKCCHTDNMAIQITIRDVPEKVRDELSARAALQGKSIEEYLRAELERLASRPSADAWLEQVRKRKRASQRRLGALRFVRARDADRR
jgi:hypothetical protein